MEIGKGVICIDPGSRLVYRYSLLSEEYVIEHLPPHSSVKVAQDLINLETLKAFDLCEWEFCSQACERYRRRKLRSALLVKNASKYPVFTTSKELSPAFSDKIEISLLIDISAYLQSAFFPPSQSYHILSNPLRLELRISLVTSAVEVLKELVQVLREIGADANPHYSENEFALKVSGKREYLRGNFPMLAFEGLRKFLRETDLIPVKLVEIPKEKDDFFPPIIDENREIPDALPYSFFWYSPEKLQNVTEGRYKLAEKRVNLPRLHELIGENENRDNRLGTLLEGESVEPFEMMTGECDSPFRVCLKGCERLNKLFLEGIWGTAARAGICPPSCIVVPKSKKEKPHESSSKLAPANSNESVISTLSERSSEGTTSRRAKLFSNMSNLNVSGASEFASLFKLPGAMKYLKFEVMLVYGEKVVKFKGRECLLRSQQVNFAFNARMEEWMNFNIPISNLPKEARLCINILAISPQETFIIGSAATTLYDEFGRLRTGLQCLNIWPFYRVEPRFSCMNSYCGASGYIVPKHYSAGELEEGHMEKGYGQIVVELEEYLTEPNVWSLRDGDYMQDWKEWVGKPLQYTSESPSDSVAYSTNRQPLLSLIDPPKSSASVPSPSPLTVKPTIAQIASLEELVEKDSLDELEEEEKELLLCCRDHYKTLPLALPLFLRAVDWMEPEMVKEAHRMLRIWRPMSPEDALCLLDTEFPDETIRFYSVRLLSSISDDQLSLFMPQLVQALQSECHHLSYLSEFLLERALRNPFVVGHELFWTLRSQLHFKPAGERFGLLLEQFLMLCGGYRGELMAEVRMIAWLKALGESVKKPEGQDAKKKYLCERLASEGGEFAFPWTLCFDSRLQCEGIKSEGSVMSSAKKPILLTFTNAEPSQPDLRIIFKVGDDMRQDVLTIQLIRVMDSIWLENGLDLRMLTYRVAATHDQVGMVEFVPDSSTTKEVSVDQGGGAFGTLKKKPIDDYLREHAEKDELAYSRSVDNFIRSCAGYSVATYILGIGDRHNDNIMLTKRGQLFHIDYGHFLGNFKSVAGINRERSAFVLTEEMAYVMKKKANEEHQSEEFKSYVKYCGQAFNLIRRVGRRFIYLFQLMIGAGMPELTSRQSIEYMREKLALRLTERQAEERFRSEISNALSNYFRKVDNMFHAIKHG